MTVITEILLLIDLGCFNFRLLIFNELWNRLQHRCLYLELKYLRIWVFVWINNVVVVLDKYFICGHDLFDTNNKLVKNPHFVRSRKWVEFWQMLLLFISVWFCTPKWHLPSLKRAVQTCIYYYHITRLNAYIPNTYIILTYLISCFL